VPGFPALVLAASFSDPEYLIDVWETDQGLPEDSATAMVQTPDGYLWFGTFGGLVRFDGVKFTVFDRSNTPELPSPGIVNLHLDRSGRLWVSTLLGMASVKDGHWTVFRENSGWIGNYARSFAESTSGELYVTTFDGKVLRFRGGGFEELPLPPADRQLGFVPHVDEAGTLWVVNPEFIGKLLDGKWQEAIPATSLLPKDKKVMAGTSRDGQLWIATKTSLRKLDRSGQLVSEARAPWPMQDFWSLHEDSAGAVWICSSSAGVYRFTPDGRWRHFTTGSGLSYHQARFVFEDREGNRWIGTSGGGLIRFKRRNFKTWGLAEGLPERVVKSVTTDIQGRIVIGTHGRGVARLAGTSITRIFPGEHRVDVPFVASTLVDRQGRLWVGSLGEGLHRVEGTTRQAFFTGHAPGSVTGASVYSLFEDSRARIWAGLDDGDPLTYEGATCFAGNQFRTYPLEGSPLVNSVRCFAEDPRSATLWAGSQAGGLYRLDGERFASVPEAHGLASEQISCLLADADGTLWVGTEDGGIACLRGGHLTKISEKQGLAARSIGAILDDGLGNLWFGSNRGILRVPRAELQAVIDGRKSQLAGQVFTLSDGLASVECRVGYQPTAVKGPDGSLWFATFRGVVMVNPKSLLLNTQPPALVIEDVLIDGEPSGMRGRFVTSAAAPPSTVTIRPGAKRLEIHYAGLSYTAPEKVRYRYMLEGLDQEWIDVGDRRVAYLQDLKPGNYRLRVKAANNDGVWNEAGAALVLAVRPHLWQTLWFRLLALSVLLGGVGLAAVRVTRNKLHRQIERLEQHRALERERALLASVLETTSDFVGFADVRGNLLYLNRAGRRLVGLSETADVRNRTIAEFHPPWAAERILKEGTWRAIRDGTWSSETALLRPDGVEIPLSQVIVAHWAEDGTVDFVSTIARDISEHKRAEEALRAAEEKYREIFENAVEGIFQTTPSGRFLAANPAMARILGYGSAEELVAETIAIDSQFYMEPDRRSDFKRIMEEHGSVQGFAARVYRRDGTTIWVSTNARAVRDASGAVAYYEGTAEDITERKRVEETAGELRGVLQKAAMEWELTFDSMEAPILIVDADGRIARLNRAARELAGASVDLVGRVVAEMGPGQPWEKASEAAALVAKTRSATHCQVRDSASGRTWDLSASPSAGPAGDDERVIVVARDLTRMVELQDSLRRSETMSAMGLLVSGVAHEVRNPLFGISANLDAFEAKSGTETRFGPLVTLMRKEVNRLTALMQDLLDYGKPVPSAPSPGTIDAVVAEAVASCASLATSSAVNVVTRIAPDLPPVPMDRKRLVQVFQNLLQNAIQHSPAGTLVSLDAMKEDGEDGPWVVLTVGDSGPGFVREDLPRVFEPFFSRRRGGTGLGLAIVHRIVEEHGGTVSAANHLQGGATISVRLSCVGARARVAPHGRVAS